MLDSDDVIEPSGLCMLDEEEDDLSERSMYSVS